jgi:hypothetical protein
LKVFFSFLSFIKHLRNQHQINYVEKIHGYRETENINAMIEECQRLPCKDDAPPDGSGGQDAANHLQMSGSVQQSVEVGFGATAPEMGGQTQQYMRPMQYENKY